MIMLESEIANLYTAAIMVFAALVPVLNPFGGAMFSDAYQQVDLMCAVLWPIALVCIR